MLDRTMAMWYRGLATEVEVMQLIAAGHLRITFKLYGHVCATAKGNKATERFYAEGVKL